MDQFNPRTALRRIRDLTEQIRVYQQRIDSAFDEIAELMARLINQEED
jgi:predicted  nucleic acid-binding Zn-ribbon protein